MSKTNFHYALDDIPTVAHRDGAVTTANVRARKLTRFRKRERYFCTFNERWGAHWQQVGAWFELDPKTLLLKQV